MLEVFFIHIVWLNKCTLYKTNKQTNPIDKRCSQLQHWHSGDRSGNARLSFTYPTTVQQCNTPSLSYTQLPSISPLRLLCWLGTCRKVFQLWSFICTLHSVTDLHGNHLTSANGANGVRLKVSGRNLRLWTLALHYMHPSIYRVFCVQRIVTLAPWRFDMNTQTGSVARIRH